jgi:hypothetical protein
MDIHHRGTETRSETREPNVSVASTTSVGSGFAFCVIFLRVRDSVVNILFDALGR